MKNKNKLKKIEKMTLEIIGISSEINYKDYSKNSKASFIIDRAEALLTQIQDVNKS